MVGQNNKEDSIVEVLPELLLQGRGSTHPPFNDWDC